MALILFRGNPAAKDTAIFEIMKSQNLSLSSYIEQNDNLYYRPCNFQSNEK